MMKKYRKSWINLNTDYLMGPKIPCTMLDETIWHEVILDRPLDTIQHKILEWLEEEQMHCVVQNGTDNIEKFWFTNEEDAMAFKLRWI